MEPEVRFLWWRDCPSWERALATLRSEMDAQGLDPERLEVIELAGEDVQPPDPEQAIGLTCRVYRRRDGRVSPMPDPEDISDALSAARRSE